MPFGYDGPNSGTGGGTPDNLGSHTATQELVMSDKAIQDLADVSRLGAITGIIDGTNLFVGGSRGGNFQYNESGRSGIGYSLEGYYFDGGGADDYFERIPSTDDILAAWFTGDHSAIINEALATAGSTRRTVLERRTYTCNSQIVLPQGAHLIGNNAVIDASAAPATINPAVLTDAGTTTALPALSANVTKGDRTVTFVSAPPLVRGDIFLIHNDTDSSFNTINSNYRAGEFMEVSAVSGSVVTIAGEAFADYATGDVSVTKLDAHGCYIENLVIRGDPDTGTPTTGLRINLQRDVILKNVTATGASHTSLSVLRSYNVQITDCFGTDDHVSSFGTDYGLAIGNSQNVRVSGGTYSAARHAVTTGSTALPYTIPCRNIHVSNVTAKSSTVMTAVDFHANAEYCSYKHCSIHGGASIAGDHITFSGNHVVATATRCVGISEAHGANFVIENNTLEGYGNFAGGNLVNIGGDGGGFTAKTVESGTFIVRNNSMKWHRNDVSSSQYAIAIFNRGFTGVPVDVVVEGNVLDVTGQSASRRSTAIQHVTGTPFGRVRFVGNSSQRATALILNSATPGAIAADLVEAHRNISFYGQGEGILINDVRNGVSVQLNTIVASNSTPISVSGDAVGNPTKWATITNNTAIDSPRFDTLNSSTRAAVYVNAVNHVKVEDNFGGSNYEYLLVSDSGGFVIGETVTAPSGATGRIDGTESGKIYVERTSTTKFAAADVITGASSSETETINSRQDMMVRNYSIFNAINAWHGRNSNFTATAINTGTITNNYPAADY